MFLHALELYQLGEQYEAEDNADLAEACYKVAFEKLNELDSPSPAAYYYLGLCYEYGHGTAPDSQLAKAYYGLAADRGYEDAAEKLMKNGNNFDSD